MTDELFRKEVFAFRQSSWLGPIRLEPPRFGWLFIGAGVLAVVTVAALLVWDHYRHLGRIDAGLGSAMSTARLSAATDGVVTGVLVYEGQRVRAGQALIEVMAEPAVSWKETKTVRPPPADQDKLESQSIERRLSAGNAR